MRQGRIHPSINAQMCFSETKSKKEKEIQFEQLQKTQSKGVEMGGGVI